MESIIRPPRTLLEVYQSLPVGTLAQLIQNELIMSPSPLEIHQQILINLAADIHFYVKSRKAGEVRVAPYDVFLNKKNVYQPDIIFLSNENLDKIKTNGFHGAPDLVIEILSPTTAKYDLEDKKDIYEQYAVKEYIVINPADKSVIVYALQNENFDVYFTGFAVVKSKLLAAKFEF